MKIKRYFWRMIGGSVMANKKDRSQRRGSGAFKARRKTNLTVD